MELKECRTIDEVFKWLDIGYKILDRRCRSYNGSSSKCRKEALQRAAEIGAATMQKKSYNKACDHSMLQSASGQDNRAKDTLLLANTINQLSPSEVIKDA